MERKYNSTTNPKNLNNPIIFNLKSTSQRISKNNYSNQKSLKDSVKGQEQKSVGDFLLEKHLKNNNPNEKSSVKTNILNDDLSLDNISNIISQKRNKLPYTNMIFDDKESSIDKNFTNSFQNKNKYHSKNLNSFSNNNTFSNNNIEVSDSHTKSFQMKMKKMKEMNKIIMKENSYIKNNTFNSSNKTRNGINGSSIINCKQKIIYMKNKNKQMNKGNIFFNDINNINNNVNYNFNLNNIINENNNKKKEKDKTIPFLCCFTQS